MHGRALDKVGNRAADLVRVWLGPWTNWSGEKVPRNCVLSHMANVPSGLPLMRLLNCIYEREQGQSVRGNRRPRRAPGQRQRKTGTPGQTQARQVHTHRRAGAPRAGRLTPESQ